MLMTIDRLACHSAIDEPTSSRILYDDLSSFVGKSTLLHTSLFIMHVLRLHTIRSTTPIAYYCLHRTISSFNLSSYSVYRYIVYPMFYYQILHRFIYHMSMYCTSLHPSYGFIPFDPSNVARPLLLISIIH